MKLKQLKGAAQCCGELGSDDGVDPRILFSREDRKRDLTRKNRQLCKEVHKALMLAVSELVDQRWTHGVTIDNVRPTSDASRLRVIVAFAQPPTAEHAAHALARLGDISGHLRHEIAAAIHRKRVPELTFEMAPPEVADE